MEVIRSSTIDSAALPDEPPLRAARTSGFSASELAHTLRALTPPRLEAPNAAPRPAGIDVHSLPVPAAQPSLFASPPAVEDATPIVLLVAAAGVSSLAPLRARLARVVAAHAAPGARLRFVDAESAAHASARARPDAILTRIERHDASAIVAIAALRAAWGVPIAATIPPSIASADFGELVAVLDDYFVEPLRAEELLIRMQCLVSRRRRALPARDGAASASAASADAMLHIDEATKRVTLHGRTLPLTTKEFELLRLLASQRGRAFSDTEIIEHLWPGSSHAAPVDVAQYVHRLRKKLDDSPHAPQWIFNIERFGYMLRRLAPQDSSMAAAHPTALSPSPRMRTASHFDSP